MSRTGISGIDRFAADDPTEDRGRVARLDAVARAAARSKDPSTRRSARRFAKESAAIEAELQSLAELPPVEYDIRREDEAKRLKIRKSTLDTEVKKRRGGEGAGTPGLDPPRWSVEAWAEPVDGAALADELAAVFRRFIVLPEHAAETLALWILHAWTIVAAGVSPLLALRSPDKRCGKSSVLIILLWLTPKSEASTSITPSAIFRFIEQSKPTLLIDELDNAIQGNRELLAILNGGHRKSTATVHRSVGDTSNFRVQRFSVWGPKAFATIRVLPGTLADRSIEIPMRRKARGEVRDRLDGEDCPQFARLRSQCMRWAEDTTEQLKGRDPYLPGELDDRAIDNWRPLAAIAEVLGGDWPKRCYDAAKALSAERSEDEERGTMLLADLKSIFMTAGRQLLDAQGKPDGKGLHTADILDELHKLKERPWPDYRKGKAITDRGLAAALKPYKITPAPVRIEGVQARGYRMKDFADAFSRYLPEDPPS